MTPISMNISDSCEENVVCHLDSFAWTVPVWVRDHPTLYLEVYLDLNCLGLNNSNFLVTDIKVGSP